MLIQAIRSHYLNVVTHYLVYGVFWHARPCSCGCARACVCAHFTFQSGSVNGEDLTAKCITLAFQFRLKGCALMDLRVDTL